MVQLVHWVSASPLLRRLLLPSCLRSRAPARSEEADAEGTSTDPDQEAHELLVSVLWVFFGLSTVAGLLSCYIKGQKAEREQGLRDKAAESRAMTYVVRALTLAVRQQIISRLASVLEGARAGGSSGDLAAAANAWAAGPGVLDA